MTSPQPSSSSNTPGSPSKSKARSAPLSFSKRTILIVTLALAGTVVFVLVVAIAHCIRRRRRLETQSKREADIERSLRRAQPPILMIDTNVPRVCDLQRGTGASRAVVEAREVNLQPAPLPYLNIKPMTPLDIAYPAANPLLMVAVNSERGPTRSAFNPPGIGGRGVGHAENTDGRGLGNHAEASVLTMTEMPELPKKIRKSWGRKV